MKVTKFAIIGSVLLLAACSQSNATVPVGTASLPPQEQVPEVSAEDSFIEGIGNDLDRDTTGSDPDVISTLVDQGEYVCDTLDVEDLLIDGAVAVYRVYMDGDDGSSAILWDNAVEHLCPDMDDNYAAVQELADLADTLGAESPNP